MIEPSIHVGADAQQVAVQAAEFFVRCCDEAIALSGRFRVVLAGGSTPKAMYELLASEPFRSRIDWAKVHVYFGDERCVPPDHADSNFLMADAALFRHVPLPVDNIDRMAGEIDPREAADEYERVLAGDLGTDGGPDLTLLGLGDDGHTASLFPDTEALGAAERRCVANHVPKLDAWRLTLTAPFINRSHAVAFLVTGERKAPRVAELLEETGSLPAAMIQPVSGKLHFFLDAAAAGMNDNDD